MFALILSLLLTAITGARGAALQVAFECAAESALLSAFGEYNRELLDRYDVFFIDLSYLSNSPDPKNLEARLNEYFDDNFHPEKDNSFLFFSDPMDVKDTNVSLCEYELATDRFGKPFCDEVVEYMSNLTGLKDLEEMSNLITVWDSYDLDTERFSDERDKVLSQISPTEKDNWEQTVIKNKIRGLVYTDEMVFLMMGKDYLDLSKKQIDTAETLMFRSKEHGVNNFTEFDFNPTENILFCEYVMSKMGNYRNQKEESRLKCETEYIIFGSNCDLMNMNLSAKALWAVRTLANDITINASQDKIEKVKVVSEALSALLEIPEPVITQIIVFLWAELEGLTDVRDLIKGKRVPLIKTSDQMNLSLEGLMAYIEEEAESLAGEDENSDSGETIEGITLCYTDYMRIFLYMLPSPIKTYRTMDVIEFNLRDSGTGNEYFRFDVCASKIKAVFTVETGFDFRYVTEKKYSFF